MVVRAIDGLGMDEKLLASVTENYGRVSADLLAPLLDFLSTASEVSEGDVEKLMIMIVVGLRSLAHPVFKHRRMRDVAVDGGLIPTLGINSRSISESLPIARESVRGKVMALIEAGWLRREAGHLHLTATGLSALTPVREKIQRLAVANYETVAALRRLIEDEGRASA
jgi:hypothetical protein